MDDLHRAERPDGVARQPDFAVAAATDALEQFVIRDAARRFRIGR
jgi:hypothetical protein